MTRRDWTELAIASAVGGTVIHFFGYLPWLAMLASYSAGWLYGRQELRRELLAKVGRWRTVMRLDPETGRPLPEAHDA